MWRAFSLDASAATASEEFQVDVWHEVTEWLDGHDLGVFLEPLMEQDVKHKGEAHQ